MTVEFVVCLEEFISHATQLLSYDIYVLGEIIKFSLKEVVGPAKTTETRCFLACRKRIEKRILNEEFF